jgi:hypothetical protein
MMHFFVQRGYKIATACGKVVAEKFDSDYWASQNRKLEIEENIQRGHKHLRLVKQGIIKRNNTYIP